jgi:Trypsin-co-occurring domain 1
MPELIRFHVDDDVSISVEVEPEAGGFQPAAAADGLVWAQHTFAQAMDQARHAAEAAYAQFRRMAQRPDEIEVKLGVRLSASAGAVLAKTTTDANVTVRLVWRSGPPTATAEDAEAD